MADATPNRRLNRFAVRLVDASAWLSNEPEARKARDHGTSFRLARSLDFLAPSERRKVCHGLFAFGQKECPWLVSSRWAEAKVWLDVANQTLVSLSLTAFFPVKVLLQPAPGGKTLA